MFEAGGRTKAKKATSWVDATTAAVGEEILQSILINRECEGHGKR